MGVILMLMTIVGLITAFILMGIAVFTKRMRMGKFVFGAVIVWFVCYAVLLFAVSLSSREKSLGLNQPKEFCGFYLDCHLHAAVTDVRKTKTLGIKIANGVFYIVKVKIFSDAKRATLGLITVDARVFDDRKREFERDTQAELQFGEQSSFDEKISPSESFEKQIVFDLPADDANPRLDIREGYGIDHAIEAILIDDEDSVLHKRQYFKLDEQVLNSANRVND